MNVQQNSTTASSFVSTPLGASLANVLLVSLSIIQLVLVSSAGGGSSQNISLCWALLLCLILVMVVTSGLIPFPNTVS